MSKEIYTIGCSNNSLASYIKILKVYKVTAIADVRSTPFSNYTPHFNSDNLNIELKKQNITYLNFSSEFGARRNEPEAYTENKVDFNKVIEFDIFKNGVTRISNGLSKGYTIALMCTEKDPMLCHRFGLVSRGLEQYMTELKVYHILYNGTVESNSELLKRTAKALNIQPDLFDNNYSVKIYNSINRQIGYQKASLQI